ncbi:unnamed protein product [Ranitomeya imitator]|uniref:Radiation-inducible immediate-early gene IEX-1 n=1 Tax=Ranitomeya imitator TaxID=111125 RepID=A0ABN9LG57_9NEOB|nr:unnamed protein product [Ranitomeya imitator]
MSRRRPMPPPILRFQDSGSDTDSEPSQLPSRSSLPEIFTFDVEAVAPVKALHRRGTLGPKGRRPRRVLYPAKVRRYLPPPETDRPLRWFYLLCLLVFVQVCCEEAEEVVVPSSGAPYGLQPGALLPPQPCSNCSHQQPLPDITLLWMYHQR